MAKDDTGKMYKEYYMIHNLHLNWLDAFNFCKSFAMDLARIESKSEEVYLFFLIDMFRKNVFKEQSLPELQRSRDFRPKRSCNNKHHDKSRYEQMPSFFDYVFVDGTKLGASHGKFYWLGTIEDINYPMNWYPGEPYNNSMHKDCLAINRFDERIGYIVVDCAGYRERKGFLCQKMKMVEKVPETTDMDDAEIQIS